MANSQTKESSQLRCSTGIPGLDDILNGGLPQNRLYLVQGDPGVGKTTLATQFLLDGIAKGERCLYITLSETREELEAVASSHGWSLKDISLFELSALEDRLSADAQTTLLHPAELELTETIRRLLEQVEQVQPSRVVLDSLSEVRLLAQEPLRYRRQLLALKTYFAGRNITVLLLDDRTSEPTDLQVHSIAHGVIELEQLRPEYGAERRRLSVAKLRGSRFRGGYHDYTITTGGLEVFPRLVASEHHKPFVPGDASSGLKHLDQLLGGGLGRGTNSLILGPAGTGKSTLALQYAVAAAKRNEKSALFAFDENRGTLLTRTKGLGMPFQEYMEKGLITLRQIDPAELSPGEFCHIVRRSVEEDDARVIIIDSLNGYLNSMPEERFLTAQLHELFAYLSQRGIVTILVLAQHGLVGQMQNVVDLTYLADTVVLLRYFEAAGAVKKAIAVIKKRSGHHEETIREYTMEQGAGVRVGPPLSMFQGVLTGIPTITGAVPVLEGGSHDTA